MLSLASGEWIAQKINVVMTGPTGTGKTWLACAFGNQACRKGLSTHFVRVRLLLEELLVARATGMFKKRLQQYWKYDLLILDDWGHEPFTADAQSDLLEIIDGRLGTKSTLITSQIPMEKWHSAIDNKTIADAILDRIAHSSHSIKLKGESMRSKTKFKRVEQ